MTEKHKDPINPLDDSINARPVNRSEIAYRNGYLQGQMVENRFQNERRAQENNNTIGGILLGIFLAASVGLAAIVFYYFNQNSEPTPSPQMSEPSNPEKETTIIEKTIERTQEIVPVPQEQPASPNESEINIELSQPSNSEATEVFPSSQENPTQPLNSTQEQPN